MPIVFISAPPLKDSASVERLTREVRALGAKALDCAPENIWVILQAKSQNESSGFPPVVLIKAQKGRTPLQRRRFVEAMARAVGRAFSLPPEDVWLHLEEMNPADIWYQGSWAGG